MGSNIVFEYKWFSYSIEPFNSDKCHVQIFVAFWWLLRICTITFNLKGELISVLVIKKLFQYLMPWSHCKYSKPACGRHVWVAARHHPHQSGNIICITNICSFCFSSWLAIKNRYAPDNMEGLYFIFPSYSAILFAWWGRYCK